MPLHAVAQDGGALTDPKFIAGLMEDYTKCENRVRAHMKCLAQFDNAKRAEIVAK
jgi:hypothetical protein